MTRVGILVASVLLCATAALAQDPVKVDPKHYKVEFENAQVRVLRIHFGAHEKSVMHSHPGSVATFLTDSKVKFTYPDGKSEALTSKAGEARWNNAVTHLPENTGDKPFELIVVEVKAKAAAAKAPAKKAPPKK